MSFSGASLDHLLEHTPALVGVATDDGRFLRISRAWAEFLGLSLEEIEGAEFMTFVHPEDRKTTAAALGRLDQNQPLIDFVTRYRSGSGEYRLLSWRADRGVDELVYFTAQDVTESQQLTETLEASNERLRQVAEIAGIGGWMVDLVNNTLFWDETTRRIHEVPEDYVPTLEAGVNFYEGQAAQDIGQAVQEGIDNQKSWDLVLPLITYTGRRIFVRASGRPLLDDGVVTRLTGTFQDVTESQEYAEQLERSRAAAESANEAKSRFLANMSHEIRTPLNGVLGMAQLLERTPLDDRQAYYLQTLRESGGALASLVDDVLDLARIEAGEVRLMKQRFDLQELVSTSRSAVAAQAAEKNLLLTSSVSAALPATLDGDAVRLKQVLINLLGNAIKFTPSGRVSLDLTLAPPNFMRITVTDTGPGVPDTIKDKIFERFTQADSSDTRQQGGAGLGLAICKDLVRLAGGRIGVTDAPDGGARFWATWPLGEEATALVENAAVTSSSQPTVLVAEDNMVNALMMQEALSQAGYTVIHARNGREAVELALDEHPDVMLLDVHMPELNGLEVVERIRERTRSPAPFLMLTADVTPEMHSRIDQLNPYAAFTKPIDIEAVLRAIGDVMPSEPEPLPA